MRLMLRLAIALQIPKKLEPRSRKRVRTRNSPVRDEFDRRGLACMRLTTGDRSADRERAGAEVKKEEVVEEVEEVEGPSE